MRKPWQHYANRAVQLLGSLVFIYVGTFTIGQAGALAQLILWPLGAIFIYWCCIRDTELFRVPVPPPKPKSSVIVTLGLKNGNHGSEEERIAIHRLTDELAKKIALANIGDFDGDEFGGGKCTLFMYSNDPESLYRHIESILRSSPLAAGAIAEISDASGILLNIYELPQRA